ncbi:MAG TPA: hypothetical protein VN040_15415, partial [Pseudosphingobacterium sp.]|nr:hypothetical protein [Pseudosphingobacterium sp.]
MNQISQKLNYIYRYLTLLVGGIILLNACSKDFLKPDPLSFYEPGATFNTESGLMSAMAICDRHLKGYWGTGADNHNEML